MLSFLLPYCRTTCFQIGRPSVRRTILQCSQRVHSSPTKSYTLPEIVSSDPHYSNYHMRVFQISNIASNFIVFSIHITLSNLTSPTPISYNEINHFIVTILTFHFFLNILTFTYCTFISSGQCSDSFLKSKITLAKSTLP